MKNIKIYGAWINKNGELIPVEKIMQHEEIAFKILGIDNTRKLKYLLYQIMYKLGYIRMTNKSDFGYTLEIKYKQKIRKIS